MPYDRFLIAPFSEGLVTALRPWLIPDEAFASLNNVYVWRGRVRKRFGGRLMGYGATGTLDAPLLSRFRFQIGTLVGGGINFTLPVDTHKNIGQQFSFLTSILTVWNPAAGANPMLTTDATATGTFNLGTGQVIIAGSTAPNGTPVYFYPGLPVMGLCNYEVGAINNQPSIGFDTQWVYQFTNSWNRIGLAEDVTFHGGNSDFFWTCNYQGTQTDHTALFVTNFNFTVPVPSVANDDNIWSYDVARLVQWDVFGPAYNAAGDFIYSARIIIPFKDRLVLLNVVECDFAVTATHHYPNRCRYSINGSPFDPDAFIQVNNVGFKGAGFIDAATEEAIVSAEFIKDRLIVYFERSTWELAYTGNQVLPFTWQKINTELGAESTFSVVAFDKAVLGIGNTGVHACSGSNVERIDTKIPDQIFEIVNKNEGVSRVAGIRDFYTEMVYWTFPSTDENAETIYPNRVLVYNYVSNCWAFNDDCITMFGNYEQQTDVIWAQETMQWQQNNSLWNSGVQQSQFRQVIAGNQQGYVFIVAPDFSLNAPVMSITNAVLAGGLITLTIIDHTLNAGDFIYIADAQGVTGLNQLIFQVQAVQPPNTIQIAPYDDYPFTGIYTGGGNITRVSRIDITTKQFNPYIDKGRDVYIAKIEFGVLATENGEITVDYSPSSTPLSMIEDGRATDTILGTSVLETHPYPNVPIEREANRLWHPIYFQTEGECIQFEIYLSDDEMTDPDIAFSDFWLEGMILHTLATTPRLQ